MSLASFFGIACGMIFGTTMVLLFKRSARANIAARYPWCATHPRGYIAVVVAMALAVLVSLYIVLARFL